MCGDVHLVDLTTRAVTFLQQNYLIEILFEFDISWTNLDLLSFECFRGQQNIIISHWPLHFPFKHVKKNNQFINCYTVVNVALSSVFPKLSFFHYIISNLNGNWIGYYWKAYVQQVSLPCTCGTQTLSPVPPCSVFLGKYGGGVNVITQGKKLFHSTLHAILLFQSE